MKKCGGCNKLVKNNFNFCFECKDKQENKNQGFIDDDIESTGTTLETEKYHKEPIPKTLKNALWINYFGNERDGKCLCCKRETISIFNYHAGHIKAEINGGKTSLENLIPLCMLCNCSMGKMNMFDFIAKYNMHYTLTGEL